MRRYLFRRLLEMIPTTFGVLMLSFILFYVIGGSPAQTVLGQHATQRAIVAFDAANGYDRPLFFGNWYTIDVLQKDASGSASLAFALEPGRYRVTGAARVSLQKTEDGTLRSLVGGKDEIIVPQGWQMVSLTGTGTQVFKHTAHFFDSQFLRYLNGLIHLDLGVSVETKQPVAQVLADGLLPTLSLSIPILFFGAILGIVFGLLCAASQGGKLDRTVLGVSTLLMSVNYVVWILLGQFLLGFKWPCFPIWGYESAYYLMLPVILGVMSGLGSDVRFYRAAILDEVYRPYVRTAVAKGVSRGRILFVHVLRNSLIPIVTYVSLSIPYLFTGSLLLETFFGIPGLGSVSINAINLADMSVVRAVVIFGALIYQLVNLLTDIAYGWLDPRVRVAS
ncbi:MAG: ABC transporter permease [Kiritimatiellia bacterium]